MCIRRPMRQWLKGMHAWNFLKKNDVPGVAKSGQAGNGQGRKWTRAGSGQGPEQGRDRPQRTAAVDSTFLELAWRSCSSLQKPTRRPRR